MFFDDFVQKLAQHDLPAFVLLAGDAEDVLAESLRRIRASYAERHPGATQRVLDGAEQDLHSLLADARTTSLFAADQLLVLRRAEKQVGGRASDEAVAALAEYLADPDPSTRLVFSAKGLRKDSRVAKMAQNSGWFVQCSEMAPWKAVAWVQERATGAGLSMKPEAAQRLLQKVGSDMGLLGTALEQWALSIHPRREARVEDLDSLPLPGGGAGVFEFLDLVAARRIREALAWVGGDPDSLEGGAITLLAGRFKELLAMAALQEDGIVESEAAARLRMHPFRVRNLWAQARRFKVPELEKALRDLIRLNSGQMTGRLSKTALGRGLERWLLCWGNPGAQAKRT